MWKGSICFFIWLLLEPFPFNPLDIISLVYIDLWIEGEGVTVPGMVSMGTLPSGEELHTTGDTTADIAMKRETNLTSSVLQTAVFSADIFLERQEIWHL